MNAQEVVAGLLRGDFSHFVATPSDRRHEERQTPCDHTPVRMVLDGCLSIQGLIVNVSQCGLGIHVDVRLSQGAKATVETDNLFVSGSIRYCVEKLGGSVFVVGFQVEDVRRIGIVGF